MKKMNRLLSLVLVLTLCVSQFAIPASALDTVDMGGLNFDLSAPTSTTDPVTGDVSEVITGVAQDPYTGVTVEIQQTTTNTYEEDKKDVYLGTETETDPADGQYPEGYPSTGSESGLLDNLGENGQSFDSIEDEGVQWESGDTDRTSEWTEQSTELGNNGAFGEPGEPTDLGSDNVSISEPAPNVTMDMTVGTPSEGSTENPEDIVVGTFEKKVDVTLQDIKDGKYPEIYDPAAAAADTEYTYEVTEGENGTWIVRKWKVESGKTGPVDTPDDSHTITGKDVDYSYADPDTLTPIEDPELNRLVAEGPQETVSGNTTTTTTYTYNTDGSYDREVVSVAVGDRKAIGTVTDISNNSELQTKYGSSTPLPDRKWVTLPAASEIPAETVNEKNSAGQYVTTTVEEIPAAADSNFVLNGYARENDVVGYLIHNVIMDENFQILRIETRKVYGKAVTESVLITTDVDTQQVYETVTTTTTELDNITKKEFTRTADVDLTQEETHITTKITDQDLYELVETAEGNFLLYQGKMYQVIDHNQILTDGSTKDKTNWVLGSDANKIQGSQVLPNGTSAWGSSWRTYLYEIKLQNGSETRMVYCVEFDGDASMDNPRFMTYYESDKDNEPSQITELRSVCLNGYWANTEGQGSLSAVKDLLRRNADLLKKNGVALTEAEITDICNNLTEKEAIAGTQTAVWKFGTPGQKQFTDSSTGNYWTDAEQAAAQNDSDRNYRIGSWRVDTLRDLLILLAQQDAAKPGNAAAQELNAEAITGSSITITNKTGETETDSAGEAHDVYNGSIAFTMNISQSSLNGNMVVRVMQNGKEIGSYVLSQNLTNEAINLKRESEDDSMVKTIFAGVDLTKRAVYDAATGSYLLQDLELAEGMKINLKLSGLQHLDKGVQIYNNDKDKNSAGENPQDFVGLVTKDAYVDVSFAVEFNVTDPEYNVAKTRTTQTRQDVTTYTADATRTDTTLAFEFTSDTTATASILRETEIYGVETTGTSQELILGESIEWLEFETPVPIDGEDGRPFLTTLLTLLGDLITIPDEQIPLAAAPTTGDATLLWFALSSLSLSGAAILRRRARREDEEEDN